MASESRENLGRLQEELGIVPRDFEGRMALLIPAYISFSPRSIDYRLIFRNVKGGFVEVNRHEAIRLMEEAVKIHMEETPPLQNAPKIIREYAKKLMVLVPKEAVMKMSFKEGENPPCIEKLLEQVKAHQNLNHQARWSLAVYLTAKNVSLEKIASIFSNLPDYDEKKTKYQLEHLKRRGYSMPSCATMLSYGMCVADCRVGSPLRWKSWKKKKKGSS
jgi:DNA primase large subunit